SAALADGPDGGDGLVLVPRRPFPQQCAGIWLMTTTTDTRPTRQAGSLASSVTFRTFAVVFAIISPVIYVICEMQNWPLFTYHPATNQIDWLYVPPVRNQGPAMHWYGWIANGAIGAGVLGVVATML